MNKPTAVIAGAGPAGLTAALELLRRSDVRPLVFEMDDCVGGISRTVAHNGNRMDIGGHRFFSKSDWVMRWWQDILPVAHDPSDPVNLTYQRQSRPLQVEKTASQDGDDVMLVRRRLSRIYYLRRFFGYPIRLNWTTLRNLGARRVLRIGFSYLRARLLPIRPERSLEDFLINRFGRELYQTFFRDYTEKVWGTPCKSISPDWGAQRIKGLSVSRALLHALKQIIPKGRHDVEQKGTETSLIERFLYPKYGPGHMWQQVARRVRRQGGEVLLGHKVERLFLRQGRIHQAEVLDRRSGERRRVDCDYFISTMPVRELVEQMEPAPPSAVRRVAGGLEYRDFITVGLLVPALKPKGEGRRGDQLIPDNWIYIQDQGVRLGRVQIFNNWSPHLVQDPDQVWLGLEYFCREGDDLWSMDDDALIDLAVEELRRIELLDSDTPVLDHHVERVRKAYPGYFGSYGEFEVIRRWTDSIPNLFLVGRNGMHRYNNQDHSMLTAKAAVDVIAAGKSDKSAIWDVNVGDDYHEEAEDASSGG
ncbi:MAG TPA: NAD(P)/FAD-dependent oxidoreductase [Acidobacteriota bacterium]|nr:NAD(P)/FAD-dependent oxidoreductase [Acidobacteriota bacterium]